MLQGLITYRKQYQPRWVAARRCSACVYDDSAHCLDLTSRACHGDATMGFGPLKLIHSRIWLVNFQTRGCLHEGDSVCSRERKRECLLCLLKSHTTTTLFMQITVGLVIYKSVETITLKISCILKKRRVKWWVFWGWKKISGKYNMLNSSTREFVKISFPTWHIRSVESVSCRDVVTQSIRRLDSLRCFSTEPSENCSFLLKIGN